MKLEKKVTVLVLCGDITKDEDSPHCWRTLRATEEDKYGPTWDRLRVEATAALWKSGIIDLIIVSGGVTNKIKDTGGPSIARVNKLELIDLGVPREVILEDADSFNSAQQLAHLDAYVGAHPDKTVFALAARWQTAWIEAMVCIWDWKDLPSPSLLVVAAEEVLLDEARRRDPVVHARLQQEFGAMYASDSMKRRLEGEFQGVSDIYAGRYKPVLV